MKKCIINQFVHFQKYNTEGFLENQLYFSAEQPRKGRRESEKERDPRADLQGKQK